MVGFQDWVGLANLAPAVPGAAARSGSFTGSAVDAINMQGPMGLLLTGTATATAVVKVQESDDGSTNWADVAGVASALSVNNQLTISIPISATETIYAANFVRTKRYLRAVITGTGHSLAGIFIGRQNYAGS